jgi:lysophospholipase L1-like esterase
MDRRTALGVLAAGVLPACGGGGGGGAAGISDGALVASSAPSGGTPGAAAFSGSSNIAAWGDSHTGGLPDHGAVPGYASLLPEVAVGRAVFNGGIAGQTSTEIANRQVADDAHDDWVNVFWYGGNNQSDPDRIKADIARSVASLAPGNNRFVVLAVVNQSSPWERRGSAGYQTIVDLDRDLAATYPDNYLDIRSYLVGLYDASDPMDVMDFNDDVVPTSLRADGVHLNAAGSLAVARRVMEFIAGKGW